MVAGAHAQHLLGIVDLVACAWRAAQASVVVELVVGADGAVLAIEEGVGGRAVLALLVEDIVYLLLGAVLAG